MPNLIAHIDVRGASNNRGIFFRADAAHLLAVQQDVAPGTDNHPQPPVARRGTRVGAGSQHTRVGAR